MIWGHFDPCHPSPVCTGGQKWLILGNNGRLTQGPWNQHGNSWTPQITSISIGKHDLGQLWPLPSIPRVHGGVKNGSFWGQNQVTMAGSPLLPGHKWRGQNMIDFRSQWQGHLAILESLWTLYTPQIKSINRNACLRFAIFMLKLLVDR